MARNIQVMNKEQLAISCFGADASQLAVYWLIRWFMNQAIIWERQGKVKATRKYQPHRTPVEIFIDPRTQHYVIQKKSYYLLKGQQVIQTRCVRLLHGHHDGDVQYSMFVDLHESESGGIISSMLLNLKKIPHVTVGGEGHDIKIDALMDMAKDIQKFLLRKEPEIEIRRAYTRALTE